MTKRYLIAAFVALQGLDVISTMYFLHTGRGVEGNPLIALCMVHLGAWWFVPKMALVLSTVPVLARARPGYVAGMNALYTYVVINNFML
jgi:hypothetical protein